MSPTRTRLVRTAITGLTSVAIAGTTIAVAGPAPADATKAPAAASGPTLVVYSAQERSGCLRRRAGAGWGGGVRLADAGAHSSGAHSSGAHSGAPEARGESVDFAGACKYFGAKAALADVSLEVEPSSFLVLLGPSGSGKTTLLRCLAGIERLSLGTISIGGRVVAGPGAHVPPERRRLAMVFQDYALWPHMTALRNVAFPLRQLRVGGPDARRRAGEMLERVGLGHLSHRYPNELSGGEQQRVALARALVGGVGLLLFDEPLSNLDADMREQLRLAISTLARDSGATSVYITHDQSEAFSLADRVGVLRDGKIVQVGPPEELYLRPASPFVARFTGICSEMPVTLAGVPRTGVPRTGVPRTGVPRTGVPTANGSAAGPPAALVDVRLPAGDVVTATLPRPVRPGDRLQMFVRPSAVHIVGPDGAPVRAQVRDVAFAGRGYEHALSGAGPLLFTRAFSEHRWERGTTVGIKLSPEGCLVLPAEGSFEESNGTPEAPADRGDDGAVELTSGGAAAVTRPAS